MLRLPPRGNAFISDTICRSLGCCAYALAVVGLCATLSAVSAQPAMAVITDVDEADDICAPSADLDFLTRTLRVEGKGVLHVGSGFVNVRAGDITFSTKLSPAVIMAAHDSFDGGSYGGVLTILARGTCSDDASVLCTESDDCGVAECLATSGNVDVSGAIFGDGYFAGGDLVVQAAGDISLTQPISMNALFHETDGGLLEFVAQGRIDSLSRLVARGGSLAQGGEVVLDAGGDILVDGHINMNGGDFDGGYIDIVSDGNVTLAGPLSANAVAGEGFGGEVIIAADGNIIVERGVKIIARGHKSAENYGDDGSFTVRYRDDGPLPIINGRVNPAPVLVPSGFLQPCS